MSIMLVRVVSVAMAAAALLVAKGAACSIKAGSYAVMADMHDGDQKTVAVSASGDPRAMVGSRAAEHGQRPGLCHAARSL